MKSCTHGLRGGDVKWEQWWYLRFLTWSTCVLGFYDGISGGILFLIYFIFLLGAGNVGCV